MNPHDPRNIGHGHVNPRPDGIRARCGGPGICAECSREQIVSKYDDAAFFSDGGVFSKPSAATLPRVEIPTARTSDASARAIKMTRLAEAVFGGLLEPGDTLDVEIGVCRDLSREWEAREPNGTATVTMKINGGARDTRR